MTTKTKKPEAPSRASLIRQAVRATFPSSPQANAAASVRGRRDYRGPKVPPMAPVDSLARIPLLGKQDASRLWLPDDRPENLRPDPTMGGDAVPYSTGVKAVPVVERPGRPPARGWRQVAQRFERFGTIVLTPDRSRATLITPGGRGEVELLYAFERAMPLIVAGLRGEPMTCAWDDAEAVTLLVGQVAWCGACTPA